METENRSFIRLFHIILKERKKSKKNKKQRNVIFILLQYTHDPTRQSHTNTPTMDIIVIQTLNAFYAGRAEYASSICDYK